jgi:subtilase family serine protease
VLAIPVGIAGGTYYVIASADADGAVTETSEGNNARTSGQVKIGADLTASLALPPPAGAGQPLVVTDTTKNVGAAPADPSSTGFYLSANSLFDAADVPLGARPVPSLVPNASNTASTTLQIPQTTASGTYFVIAKADVAGVVAEGNETNNLGLAMVRIGPDLNVSAFTGPSSAQAGATITVTDAIKNLGGGTAGASATRFYLSTNASFDASDTPLGARAVGTIDPGATDSGSMALTLPANLATATYFLIAVADGDAEVPETNEANNWRTLIVNVTAAP